MSAARGTRILRLTVSQETGRHVAVVMEPVRGVVANGCDGQLDGETGQDFHYVYHHLGRRAR